MSESIIFTKADLVNKLLKSHNFSDIDDAAFLKLQMCVDVLVSNILSNVLSISGSKNIAKKHFTNIVKIMNNMVHSVPAKGLKGKVQSGGSGAHGHTVFPIQFFGGDNTHYTVDSTSGAGWTSFDTGARPALPSTLSGGGNSSFITLPAIKRIVNDFLVARSLKDIIITKGAYIVILECVIANIDLLISVCSKVGKNRKKVTTALLYSALNKHCQMFAHLSHKIV